MKIAERLLALGCVWALACCLVASSLWAQTASTGALTVTVSDKTNAVIPGAKVTVLNTATGQSRTQVTDAIGSSTFTLLPVGVYRVTISAPGFSTAEVPAVTISVTETHVLNQSLAVGEQSQQVVVNTDTQQVQTESATQGGVVNGHSINELPLVTRNYTQILSLSPGTAADVTNAAKIGHGTPDMYVNGNANTGNNFQMDGAEVNSLAASVGQDTATTYGSIAIPSPDAIQEFKVQTAMYDASYGRSAGGNVNVVTKSGTNRFHGTLFEFLRNDDLNANDYFRNSNGLGRAELKQNQFGGTLGGPFMKDKLFFLISYEGTRQVNGVDTTASSSVTLPPQLTDANRTAAGLGAAFCPANNPAGSTFANTKFGGVQVACDGSNINPVALALLTAKLSDGDFVIPSPQKLVATSAGMIGSSVFSVPSTYNENQYLGNLDYVISSKHTLSNRYFYSISPESLGFDCQPCLPGSSGDLYTTGNQNESVKLTSLLTNNLVNEALFSLSYIRAQDAPTSPLTTTQLGMTPAGDSYSVLPVITIGSPAIVEFGGATTSGKYEPQTTYQWADQLSWNHGRHTVRTGYRQEKVFWLDKNYGLQRGSLTYQSFPDLLLGLTAAQNGSAFSNVFGSSATLGTPLANLRANAGSAFGQDDIKVNQKLTLNVGVRWEYDGTIYETSGNAFQEWLSLYQTEPVPPPGGTYVGLTMPANYKGTLPPGILRRSGNVQTLNGSPRDDFSPRIGLAWQPLSADGRFVVQAGYGWFYSRVGGNEMASAAGLGPPIATPINLSGATNTTASDQNPFPPTAPVGFAPFLRTTTSKIAFSYGIDEHLIVPLSQSYNLNLQFALKPTWILQVGYAGARNEHLASLENFNIPQLATATGGINCGVFSSSCITTNTAANAPQRVPIVGVGPGGIPLQGNYGDSNYNAGQLQLRKAFSHGLQFQAAYTYGKTMTDFEAPTTGNGTGFSLRTSGGDMNSNDPSDSRQKYGPADWNRTQRLVVNYSYQIPDFQKDKGFTGRALSGWGVSGVTTAQTGNPLTLTDATGAVVYGSSSTSRAELCPGSTNAQIPTKGSLTSRLNNYFNSSAFCAIPVIGQVNGMGGATGYGDTSRGVVHGPGQFNWDLAATKMTRVGGIHEDADLQFRAEFFNAFNHPQFSNPGIGVGSASFGVINTASVAPRIIQFALKYIF